MVSSVDQSAGKIWNYLDKNGPSSVTKILAETEISKSDVQRAIGWLLKEDKLILETVGRTETISLK
jgi:predicted RNA-binding protein (virulence factor B family)